MSHCHPLATHPTLLVKVLTTRKFSKYCTLLIAFVSVMRHYYHELSSISKDLPPLYRVKRARLCLNSTLELQRFSGPLPGAYRPLRDALTREIQNIVSNRVFNFMIYFMLSKPDWQIQTKPSLVDPNTVIMVKISGDGARFSKSSNLILMSFSLPELQENILSGAGIAITCSCSHPHNYKNNHKLRHHYHRQPLRVCMHG